MSGGDFCGGGFTILGTKEECKEVLRLLSYYSHEKYEQWEQGHTVHGWYLMGYEDCRSIFSDEFANDPISPEELLQGMYHDGGMEIYLFGPYTCGLSGAHDFDFF